MWSNYFKNSWFHHLFLSSYFIIIGSNSFGAHITMLNTEIGTAQLLTINERMTVSSEWGILDSSRNKNSKWIKYCGPSYVASVHKPWNLPNVIWAPQISSVLSMQKESNMVASNIFSRKNASSQALSNFGNVWPNLIESGRLHSLINLYNGRVT